MTESSRILLVDDDTTALTLMQDILKSRGFLVDIAESVTEAENKLKTTAYHVIVSDYKMPKQTGIDLLNKCVKKYPETAVIIITGHGTIRHAVDALKLGAFEYLSKPVQMDELVLVIQKAIDHRKLLDQNLFLQEELKRVKHYFTLTSNVKLQRVYDTIEIIRNEDTSVLIQGESGTGKEVIALQLHNSSPRKSGNFVPINCGAIPEHLIESELFGYEKGAFTGADKRNIGKLEIANGGTLFLDEVNELPPKAQVALLRFLQEQELSPLGSNRRISVNVRIITATNANLPKLVRKGAFREDLFYRINVLPLQLPPLRERKEDIIPLANWFLLKFKRHGLRVTQSFSPDAEERLKNYHWPGNIRELRNCIDRATIFCREPIIDSDSLILTPVREAAIQLDSHHAKTCFDDFGIRPLRDMENKYINWVVKKYDGNKTQAAKALEVSLRGLRYKLNTSD